MGATFVFDIMSIIGKTLEHLIKNNQWSEVNYTNCYTFTSTNMTTWTQATLFRQQILKVDVTTTKI